MTPTQVFGDVQSKKTQTLQITMESTKTMPFKMFVTPF